MHPFHPCKKEIFKFNSTCVRLKFLKYVYFKIPTCKSVTDLHVPGTAYHIRFSPILIPVSEIFLRFEFCVLSFACWQKMFIDNVNCVLPVVPLYL